MSQSLIEQFRQEDAANGYTPGQNVRPALEVAASTNADQQARSMQLAEELGLTREVVQEQSAWAEQEAKARRIERNPLFARWAEQSETNAAFARDDTEKMGDVFEILANGGDQDVVRAMLRYNAKRGDKTAQARLQSEFGMSEDEAKGIVPKGTLPGRDTMDWGLLEAHMPRVIEPIQDVLGGFVQAGNSFMEGSLNVAKSAAGFMALLGENMDKVVLTIGGEDAKPMWQALAKNAREAEEYIANLNSDPLNAEGYLNDFVRNLPQVLASIPVAYFGGPIAGTAFMGSQIAGGTYADLTQKHEVHMPTAAELEEGARMVARAAAQGWQGAVNNARMAAHEAGGEGGALYEGEEPDELAMASARARVIAAAILNTEQSVPAGTAAIASLANAAIQAPLEMIGFGKLFDVFKSTGAGNLVKRIVESAATEFVTETVQQHPDEFARIWAEGTARGEGWQDVWQKYTGQFWDITKEGMYAGALSAPFGLLGGIGKAATDVRMAKEAVDWAQAHIAFHAKVEETKAKQVAPALVQQALEEGGMRDMAHVDGEALYQLAQEDPQVLAQLGIEEKAVQQAAEAGQTITLPMSKVHARLQQEQLPKFMAIARREPESWTVQEADVLPETLKQTAERAAEEVATKAEAARLAEIEIRRIREEAIQAVSSVPTLMAKLQSDGTSPEAYVDNNLEIIVRQAKYLAEESGSTMAEALRDYTVEGLDYDPSGKLTPIYKLRDKDRLEEERAIAEAERPFWELVWGRVDPESLKADYAETYREFRKSKRGLFMPGKLGGVAIDQIAAELNERGIFTGSADDLVELLKTKERPRRGMYQEGDLTEQEEKAEAAQRVQEWLSEENLAWAQGKNRDEIVARFGDELETVALLPEAYLDYFAGKSADNKVYSGKGYFIDHAVNHHPDIAPEEYGNLQAILDAPDEVLRDTRGKENDGVRDGLIFIKKIDKTYGIAVTMEADQGMIVMHKSFFKTRKGAFKKLERLPIAPVGSTSSTIQSDGGTVPGGSLSALGAESSIAQAGEEVNSLEQRAFHGSPHRFMKFMLEHIGSGEGNQAYGWGLYFAQDRDVAERYRRVLAGDTKESMYLGYKATRGEWRDADGNRADDVLERALNYLSGENGDVVAAIRKLNAAAEKWNDATLTSAARYLEENFAANGVENIENEAETPGQVYEVNIPENDVLLHADKSMEDQPEIVKKAAEALLAEDKVDITIAIVDGVEYLYDPAWDAWTVKATDQLITDQEQLERLEANRQTVKSFPLDWKGEDFYDALTDKLWSDRAASIALNEAGVKGLTYVGGQDGRSFVIFDDQAIDMLDTYYQLAQGNTVVRGETVPAESSGGMGDVIRLFYHADLSTLTHESAHVFFLQMKRLVDAGRASERMKADYDTLCQWVGSKDGYLTTSQHEVLARGMELFLREGKAPSKKLANAFARFRRWLTDIYKTVAGNPYFNVDGKQVELNPDVRRVFGRILATQEEVEAQAAEDVMGSDWTATLDRLGMTGAQRIAISGLIQDAKNYAETELYRQREADKKERLAKWRKEADQQIESERVYRARTALRSRKGYGLDMLALANVVGNERALEFFKKLPGIKREGASPWAFAADFGYDSVEEFVDEVMAAPTKKERMAELMAAKEQEYDMQYRSESLLVAEETAKAQEMMHEHLIKLTGSRERGVPLEQLKSAASDIMATLPIEQATSVGKFRYQAKRLMRAQHEAIMRRDFGRALDITYKLRLNLELTVQAQKNKKEFDALTRDLARFTASKEPNPVVRYGVARLAMKHGLLAPTKMILRTEGDKELNDVSAWFENAQMQGYPIKYDDEVWQAQLPTWRQMNSETFRRVYSQLKSMMTVERQMRHVDVQGKKMALDQYSQALGRHMLDNDPNRQDLGFAGEKSLVQATKDFLDPLSTVNARLKMYDNFKPLGMAWRAIMEPMNKAEAKRSQFFRKYAPMLQKLITSHYDAKRLVTMKDRKKVPGLKKAVSHEKCIMVGLNVGNAGNRLRLMNGFKNTKTMQDYGEAEVQAMLDQLDENDWRFIQEVWDFFEQFKKESFDMEERLTGVRPLEVQARPVPTRFGTFRGGYFPIAYDPDRGAKAANQQLAGGKNVMMPSVYHGMMKDRGDQGLGTPLDLRFSVITDKLAETGHNLAYREPVIEVAKLLRSHAVSRAIAATEGPVVELKFWRWLSALAGERPTRNSMDKIASWATSRMAIYAMGFKATTMIAQASGLLATSTQIGPRWTARGVRDTFNGGDLQKMKDMWQDTCARSPMMMDRLHSFDRDVYAMSKRLFETGHKNQALNLLKKTESWLTEHAFTLTGLVQLWMVDIPTWRGAFAKGMEELNMTEEEAALYADDMVVTAQGSGATKDMADIMREQGFMRVMTMFYSYFSAMYNMFMLQGAKTLRHPKEEWPYLASMAFVLWFIEPMLTGYATGRGPDDDEEWHEWFLLNGVKQPFQMVPIIRDLSGAWFNHIEGKFGSDYRFTPAADVIGAFEKTLEHGADLFTSDDYESRKKAAKRLARDVGMISGTPFLSSQAITTIGNMWDWLDGTEEFALRDLLFTRKK